jgi:hypothetical protein
VHEVVGAGVRAVRLTPIVVHSNEATVEDDRQRIWPCHWNYIHHPYWLCHKRSCKPASQHHHQEINHQVHDQVDRRAILRALGLSLKPPYVPSIASLHVHHVADGAPLNAKPLQVRLLDDPLPMFRVCTILFSHRVAIDSPLRGAQPGRCGLHT